METNVVRPKSAEAGIIEEELRLLAEVQKQLAEDQLNRSIQTEYDQDLLSLRDQISEARLEDVAPLVAEMYRMQALGAANGKGRDLPVDVQCPYFGHLKLNDGKKVRDVLIGSRGFVRPGQKVAIVDWRNAPISRIYYCYDEGDDYEEQFGDRLISGLVEARRTVGIIEGQLRRISWSGGSLARRGDGTWVSIPLDQRPVLKGGAGVAARPPAPHQPVPRFKPGSLGVVGDESLREDKHLKEITALIDPVQFGMITKPDSGIVILQGGAGSGKTTVALHRAAYLHFNDAQTFSPKKMVVVVKSAPLTEYISRVLPSLDVSGTPVVTLEDWMQKTRRKVLPEIDKGQAKDVPAVVARLKKHPAILRTLELGVEREAASLLAEMAEGLPEAAAAAVSHRWAQLARYALLPRIREMKTWVESPRSELADAQKARILGVLRRAKTTGGDILEAWAQLLTDSDLVESALEQKAPGVFAKTDVAELVRWVSLQAEEEELDGGGEAEEEDDRETRSRSRRDSGPAEDVFGIKRDKDDGDGDQGADDDRRVGVDGRALDEGTPKDKLDEHDDALLLKLMQLKFGGLSVPGATKSVAYEHIIVDEAQDLSPTDIAVLRGTLTKRESMTLAGDTAQKLVFDNAFEDWETMLKDVGVEGVKIDRLKISYRSTQEIVDFSRHVLGPLADPEIPVVPRRGVPVEQFPFGSTGEAVAFLGEALRSLVLREKKANIAVVARYGAHANTYYEGLRKSETPSLRRVYGKEFSFSPGIDVVEISQIKGLEYDYVILVEVNQSTYPETRESRHLLHIASTRAVHQLWVTSVGKRSPLLPPELI